MNLELFFERMLDCCRAMHTSLQVTTLKSSATSRYDITTDCNKLFCQVWFYKKQTLLQHYKHVQVVESNKTIAILIILVYC